MARWPRLYYLCTACQVRGVGSRCWYCKRKRTLVPYGTGTPPWREFHGEWLAPVPEPPADIRMDLSRTLEQGAAA